MSLTTDQNQSESSPLLQQQRQHEQQEQQQPNEDFVLEPHEQCSPPSTTPTSSSWQYIIALCGISMILIDTGGYLFQAPQIRLYESIICARYLNSARPEDIPESLCKINAVQDELAMLLGWQVLFDNLPGILLAIPYCTAADKHGRKWILVMNFVGIALDMLWILLITGLTDLPIRYTWMSSIFLILGGGGQVATALLFTIIADVVPVAQRSTMFFYITAAVLISELIAAPAASLLMGINIWAPLIAGLISQIFGVLVATAIPETLPPSDKCATSSTLMPQDSASPTKSLQTWKKIKESVDFMFRDTAVAFLIVGFLVLRLGRQSMAILLQYVSKRYDWSLAQANFLLSLRAAVNLVLLIAILPSISALMLKRSTSTRKDVWISRGSIILLVLGSIGLGVSVNPVLMIFGLTIYTLGTGYPSAVRSLVTTLVDAHESSAASDIARLYAIIAVADGVGSLFAGPSLSYAFYLGLQLGGNWIGLPFLFAAGMFLIAGLPLFSKGLGVEKIAA